MIKKISKLSGGLLLIDYGYLNKFNKSTLQSINKTQKLNEFIRKFGKS